MDSSSEGQKDEYWTRIWHTNPATIPLAMADNDLAQMLELVHNTSAAVIRFNIEPPAGSPADPPLFTGPDTPAFGGAASTPLRAPTGHSCFYCVTGPPELPRGTARWRARGRRKASPFVISRHKSWPHGCQRIQGGRCFICRPPRTVSETPSIA